MTGQAFRAKAGAFGKVHCNYKQTLIRQSNPALSDLYEDIAETIPDKPERQKNDPFAL